MNYEYFVVLLWVYIDLGSVFCARSSSLKTCTIAQIFFLLRILFNMHKFFIYLCAMKNKKKVFFSTVATC